MVDKENFRKDINVPSKESIIIDGIDVSRCVHLVGKEACNSRYCRSVKCGKNLNCLFKQLAYKTQECERMKYYLDKIITYVEYALGVKKDD